MIDMGIHDLCISLEPPSNGHILQVTQRNVAVENNISLIVPPNTTNTRCLGLLSNNVFKKLKTKLNQMKHSLKLQSLLPSLEDIQKDAHILYQEKCLEFTQYMFPDSNSADQVHLYKAVSFMGLVIQALTSLDTIETSHYNVLARVMLLAIIEGTGESIVSAKWRKYCQILLPKDSFTFGSRLPEYRHLCLSRLSIVPPNDRHLTYYTTKYNL